ncbi:MAG: hypothetical protein ACR2ME_11755 [Acidimicrobiia bacterium]
MILRIAGAVVSIAVWLGLIVFALDNLDTGLPRSEGLGGGWPFWVAAVAVVVVVALFLRRSPGSPGWGTFLLGLLIPEVAFFINRLFTTDTSFIFLIAVAVLVLIPLPTRRAIIAPGSS